MNTIYATLMLLLMLPLMRASKTISTPNYDGIFVYDCSDLMCTNFAFIQCTWWTYRCDTDCSGSSDDSSSGSGAQSSNTKTSDSYVGGYYEYYHRTNWDDCMRIFCDPQKKYEYAYRSFQICKDDLIWKKLILIMKTTGIVFASFNALYLLAYICSLSGRLRHYQNLPVIIPPEIGNQNNSQLNLSLNFLTHWNQEQSRSQRLNQDCSICLESRPNLQLQCGHIFHPKCIIAALNLKKECILCRTKEFNKIKVYCQSCFLYSFSTTLNEEKAKLASKPQICDRC